VAEMQSGRGAETKELKRWHIWARWRCWTKVG